MSRACNFFDEEPVTDTATPRLLKLDLKAPHQTYKLANGEEVPGVTSLLKSIDPEPLMYWAWDMGRQNHKWPLHQIAGADLGTVAHARIRAFLEGYDGVDPEGLGDLIPRSEPAFQRFKLMWQASGYKLAHSELQLVSERMKCGGTLDIIASDPDGHLVLIDLKTTKPYRFDCPYAKHCTQLGGYSLLARDNVGMLRRPIERLELWRLGKDADDPGSAPYVLPMRVVENGFEAAVALHYAIQPMRFPRWLKRTPVS